MTDTHGAARARHARRIGFTAWAALLVLECLWHGWWQTPFSAPAFALAVVPLLLPLIALRRPMRALLWAGIIAVFYFGHGVSDAWIWSAMRVPGLVEAVLSVVLIVSLGIALPRPAAGNRASGMGNRQDEATRD